MNSPVASTLHPSTRPDVVSRLLHEELPSLREQPAEVGASETEFCGVVDQATKGGESGVAQGMGGCGQDSP